MTMNASQICAKGRMSTRRAFSGDICKEVAKVCVLLYRHSKGKERGEIPMRKIVVLGAAAAAIAALFGSAGKIVPKLI